MHGAHEAGALALALLNLCRASKALFPEGRGCACTRAHVWCECYQRASAWCEREEILSVVPLLLQSHSVTEDPPPSAMGSENGYQVSMIRRVRPQQTGKLSLLAPHGRNNLTTYFDLKTLYISNVIKKLRPV